MPPASIAPTMTPPMAAKITLVILVTSVGVITSSRAASLRGAPLSTRTAGSWRGDCKLLSCHPCRIMLTPFDGCRACRPRGPRRRIPVSQKGLPRRRIRFGDRRGLEAWNTLLTFFNLVRAAVAVVLGPVKLSNDELLVLICLAHTDGALSMGAIERSTFLRAGRLRRAVDKLETRQVLAWRRSRADRRKALGRMTKAGRQPI